VSDPFDRVQRTAPAVTPPADVLIRPPETGLDTLLARGRRCARPMLSAWLFPRGGAGD
jgi:hypothetical protein